MRREGFELGVSRPHVILKEIDGKTQEPFELLVIECEEDHQGGVMEELGIRRGDLQNMVPDGHGRIRLEYEIPAKGLLGFRSMFMTLTSGTGIMTHSFSHYGDVKSAKRGHRNNGVMISKVTGKAVAYALYNLQERGTIFIDPNTEIYEGMIVGLNSRTEDMVVNPMKTKNLTNVRAAGSDDAIQLTKPVKFTLEKALEFIEDDELVEVTPNFIRVRKKELKESDRKRSRKEV